MYVVETNASSSQRLLGNSSGRVQE